MTGYKRFGLQLASHLGLTEEVISLANHLSLGLAQDPAALVDERLRDVDHTADDGGSTVLLPLFPSDVINQVVQCTLGYAFNSRGHGTLYLRCSDDLAVCSRAYLHEDEPWVHDVCGAVTENVSDAFGVPTRAVADVLPSTYSPSLPANERDLETYRGVEVARLARGATRQYFLKYNIDLDEPTERRVYVRYLRTAVTLVDAYEELLSKNEIDATIAFDDHYIYGGVALAVSANHGIPAYSVELGFLNETLVFGRWTNRNSLPMFTDTETVRRILSSPLSPDEQQRTEELLADRVDGKRTKYLYSSQTDVSVDRSDDRTLVGMFTNLTWDASLEVQSAPFPNMFEWLERTINLFEGRDDVELVVKTHPAEKARVTREPVKEWIEEHLGPLASNVTVLPPDTEVNTYELIDDLDLGVVYSSTVGLEMVTQGVPVVVGGDSHYCDLDITYDPVTASEYVELLSSPADIELAEEMPVRAERYVNFFFFDKHIDYPFVTTDENDENHLSYISHDELVPGNRNFDLIVEGILAGEPVLNRRARPVQH